MGAAPRSFCRLKMMPRIAAFSNENRFKKQRNQAQHREITLRFSFPVYRVRNGKRRGSQSLFLAMIQGEGSPHDPPLENVKRLDDNWVALHAFAAKDILFKLR